MISCSRVKQRPNLIILFSDDAGYADFGFQGSVDIRTPVLDRLAESGVRFTNGYVTASVCSPSRAGMLTGRYQQRFGHEMNLPGMLDPAVSDSMRGLPLSEITLADILVEIGYATGLVGKWHLGLEDGMAAIHPDSLGYLTDEFGDRAANFIERHSEDPFFLFLSFTTPHTPMQAREDYLGEVRDGFETEERAKYAAMMRSLDDNVGKVLAKLEELGLRENTFIVFANDNGGAMPFNASLNAPLRGAKGTALEGLPSGSYVIQVRPVESIEGASQTLIAKL